MPDQLDEGFLGLTDPLAKLANSLHKGAVWLLEKLSTFWLNVDAPAIGGEVSITNFTASSLNSGENFLRC